jgi:hypothetical protein
VNAEDEDETVRGRVPTREEIAARDIGEVLARLIARFGHERVGKSFAEMMGPHPKPVSAERAITTPGRFICETPKALLWFVPSADDPARLDGLAAWCPRSLIVDFADPMLHRRDPLGPEPPLGMLRTVIAMEWRKAMRVGSTVRFLDERRSA